MTNEIKVKKDGYFDIGEAAGVVPMALEPEQIALNQDIKDNGQREPVILWRGKIVDGRCRQKALELHNMQIEYKELDNEVSEEDVETYVKSVNTRRNLSLTQKIIVAVKESMKPGSKSISKISKSWGISPGSLNNGRYIAKFKSDFIEPLFDGKSVDIINKDGDEVLSNKITAIYAYVKREQENIGSNEKEHSWQADSHIRTQVGKEWFYDVIKEHNIKNVDLMMILADTANCKYRLEIEDVDDELKDEIAEVLEQQHIESQKPYA